MKLEARGSEVQFSRHAINQNLRYHDTKCQNISRNEISRPMRHKHTAESICCIQSVNGTEIEAPEDHEYNETNLPFRQRTNSTTTIAKFKKDTDVVKSASRTSSATPGSISSLIKQSSKQKLSFPFLPTQPETTLSLSLSTASAKGPRKKKLKKGGSGPVPQPPPSIFNVGKSSLLSGLVSISSTPTTRSTFSLDDTSSWDMDTLPSIPSPPDSPTHKNDTATIVSPNSYSTSSNAPFSTPYDEDALLENEIPFPLNRHSNVIIENMGIKKTKNLSKRRERLLNRHITTLRPYSGRTNPHPLNRITLNPMAGISFERTLLKLKPTTPISAAGPSSSRKDAWGCMHLGSADCELFIAFPQTSQYEVWDMGDDAFFACPLFLCLMAKDPHVWAGTPIALPDVSLIDIRCDDLPVPSSMSVYDPSSEYGIQCIVPQKTSWDNGLPPYISSSHTQKNRIPVVVDHKEITIDGTWERTFIKPKMERRGQARILRLLEGDGNGEMMMRGWYLKFWIPIPSHLFMKRETRIFEIRASLWMMGDEERVLSAVDSEEEDEYLRLRLVAETEMTVSHLRMEREMMSD